MKLPSEVRAAALAALSLNPATAGESRLHDAQLEQHLDRTEVVHSNVVDYTRLEREAQRQAKAAIDQLMEKDSDSAIFVEFVAEEVVKSELKARAGGFFGGLAGGVLGGTVISRERIESIMHSKAEEYVTQRFEHFEEFGFTVEDIQESLRFEVNDLMHEVLNYDGVRQQPQQYWDKFAEKKPEVAARLLTQMQQEFPKLLSERIRRLQILLHGQKPILNCRYQHQMLNNKI